MGLSMGGLVARYALCDMENRSEDHDTRLYISYDSPQQGANVPLSFQKLAERLDNYWLLNLLGLTPFFDIDQLEDAYNMLKSPAAQQMLVLGGVIYNSFYNELGSMGYPSCTNIALANGSMQSVLYPSIQYGNLLAELDVEIAGGLLVNMDANCFALANNSYNRIYYDNFGIFQWLWVYAQSIPFDNAPGGIYDYDDFGLNAQEITDLLPGNNSQFSLTSDGFSFVPTASAFGITLSSSTLQASVTSAGQTPFDNIFINNSSNNETHIELTTAKRNWILQQIAIGDVIDGDVSCLSISAPELICYSGSTASIQNVPGGTTITWGGTNVAYPNGNTGTSVTVRAASSSTSGNGTITASFSIGGTPYTISKPVWAGPPIVDYITDPIGSYNPVQFYAVPSPNCGTIDSYTWIVSPDAYIYSWMDHAEITFPEPNTYYIGAKATNTCGPSNYWAYNYFMYEGDYLMSPNPASTEIEITFNDSQSANSKSADLPEEEYLVTITDISGVTKIQKKYKGKRFTIPVQNLNEGNYFVNLKNNKLNETKQLIIKRQ